MRTFLCTLSALFLSPAVAQKAITVDPHDFTRTPCEYRRAPCPGETTGRATATDNKVLESGQISVLLASGSTIEATVSLVAISPRAQNHIIEKRVIVVYETLYRELRSTKARSAVYARLASVARAYGVRRTDVAACRPGSAKCEVSSFESDDTLADD